MARFLVLDDDPISREIVRSLLKDHDVVEASTTEEGIDLYKSESFEAVITDLFIPARGGLEVIRAIRELDPDARLIAVSGIGLKERGELLTMAHDAGARHALKKPLDPDEFHAAVEDVLSDA